jgi:hypothetical protein
MLELRKNLNRTGYFDVLIEGTIFEKVYAYGKDYLHYYSQNRLASQKLIHNKLADFENFDEIWLESVCSWLDFEHLLWIQKEFEEINKELVESDNLRINFNFDPRLKFWNKDYSFVEYSNTFVSLWKYQEQFGEFKYYDEETPTLGINFTVPKFKDTISDFFSHFSDLLETTHKAVLAEIFSNSETKALKALFDFPKSIQISCEQYLFYFAKFLQDLGINATSNLKEEAGKVLFSVTPTDDVEALDKIREALAVYLNLPASSISDLEYCENFALMRLQQQVRNLQHSQQMAKTELLSAQYALSLAQSNIENQDQIIVRQHSTIENLNKVIEKITSNSIMTDSLEKKDKEEFEEVCEGLRVGESKWLRELTGVGLSTGKFVKAIVKNTFGKEEKNSVLGLDED